MDFKSRYKYNTKEDLLGKGGFSRVFKATDVLLEREVALKVFNSEQSARYDLITEIKKVIKFQHDNLCRYYDVAILQTVTAFGEEEVVQVGVMELLNGGELKRYLSKNPQYLNKLLEDVLQGLSYLHKRNIIHRDLKPQNILIKLEEDGPIAKITDFGISKAIDEQGDNSSALLGTVEYMAPEQFNPQKYGINGQISTHIDLWSFGIMVYELLAGRSLFGSRSHGTSAELVMRNILGEEYLEKLKELPAPYNEIASLCLVKEASKRVKSADVLLEILRKSYNGNNNFNGVLNGQDSGNQNDETMVLNLSDGANGNNNLDDAETQLIFFHKPDPGKPENRPANVVKAPTPPPPPVVKQPAAQIKEPAPKPTPIIPKVEEPRYQPAAKREPEVIAPPNPAYVPPVPEPPKPAYLPPVKAAEPALVEKPKPVYVAPPAPVDTPKPAPETVAPLKPAPAPEPVVVKAPEPIEKPAVKEDPNLEPIKMETVAPEAKKVTPPVPVKETPKAEPLAAKPTAEKKPEAKPVAATEAKKEPAPQPVAKAPEVKTEAKPEPVAVNNAPAAAAPVKKKSNLVPLSIAAGIALLLAVAAFMFWNSNNAPEPAPVAVEPAAIIPTPQPTPIAEPKGEPAAEKKAVAKKAAGKSGYVTAETINAGTSNAFVYTGNLKNGLPDGKGEQKFKNGAVYAGTFLNGNYHKDGVLTLVDGSKYELQYIKGKAVTGNFNYANGDFYKGSFVQENGTVSENGKGSRTWANGDKYVGTWKKGKKTNGTFYYKDGTLYKGDFVNNKKEGKGKFLYADGARYEGEFKNDNFNGTGKKFNADGELTESGLYKNGVLVKANN